MGRPAVHRALAAEAPAAERELVGDGVAIEVDGGIDPQTAPACARAGARLFVAGSAVFHAPDPAEAFRELDRSLQEFR